MVTTIIRTDSTVSHEGITIGGLDLSWISPNIHAVVWHGDHGEIQYCDDYLRITENRPINSFDEFDRAIQQWKQRKLELDSPPVGPPTEKELVALYTGALERMYDEKAQERNYDNRFTCTLRAGYPGPFQMEGIKFAQWMDLCNFKGYEVLALVKQGNIPLPSVEEFLAQMPKFSWEEQYVPNIS